jgi:Domain of unknown function (DUF4926)
MNATIKLLDVVALTVDRPERGLVRGQVGTVVEELAAGVFDAPPIRDHPSVTALEIYAVARQLQLNAGPVRSWPHDRQITTTGAGAGCGR